MQRTWIAHSKLQPPRLRPPYLHRSRLYERLGQGLRVPLTIVHAGAGYGKSTTVAAFLSQREEPFAWYSMSEQDGDPLLFAAHLVTMLGHILPRIEEELFPLLESVQRGTLPWGFFADLVNDHLGRRLRRDIWLVFDDVHLVASSSLLREPIEAFLASLPSTVHLILTTRRRIPLEPVARALATGQALLLTESDLALTAKEVAALFRDHFLVPLSDTQAAQLSREVEGWPMALQLLGRRLQGKSTQHIEATLKDLPARLDVLFDYLTESVITRLRPEVRTFLFTTAVLRFLTAEACDAVRRTRDSARLLTQLQDTGLALVQVDEQTYRHHHLVHEFLLRQLRREMPTWRSLHRRAAAYFAQRGEHEEAVYHLLEAGDFEAAAHQISTLVDDLIANGRLLTLRYWLHRLPPTLLDERPDLHVVLGHLARFMSRYEDAMRAYRRAEHLFQALGDRQGLALALQGQAQVFIDTVQPRPAEALLRAALRTLGREHPAESSRVLRLMAENAVNQGRPGLARRWYAAAQRLDPIRHLELEVRIHLRSGHLDDARALLQTTVKKQPQQRPARGHREPCLLLSLVQVLRGEVTAARQHAMRGLHLAHQFHSPFTEAVAHMRLGHAWQLPPRADMTRAREHYENALTLVRRLNVPRGEAEPLFGLTLLHAFTHHWQAARAAAHRGLEVAESAGDRWIAGLLRLALGIADALHAPEEVAHDQLLQALNTFLSCEDSYGAALAHMWLAWLGWHSGNDELFAHHVREWLHRSGVYSYLHTHATLFGFRDPQVTIALLVAARQQGMMPLLVERRLFRLGLPADLTYHPGYTLHVRTLGTFAVRRGDVPVAEQEWRREKARRLFQFFLVHRGHFLQREQIWDALWPGLPPKNAENHFKVALNALNRALEPGRSRQAPPFFVIRQESAYGLNRAAAIEYDADVFLDLLASADRLTSTSPEDAITHYRDALAMYNGPFLPDALYEDWTRAAREHLTLRFLEGAESLAQLLLPREPRTALEWCERIWNVDACWEPAYRIAMRAYHMLGNRHMVARVYRQCQVALQAELGIAPSGETRRLFEEAVHAG